MIEESFTKEKIVIVNKEIVKRTKSCMCPVNCEDIYNNKILNETTIRCKKKAIHLLYTPNYKIHNWPICINHLGFFTINNIPSIKILGKYSHFYLNKK